MGGRRNRTHVLGNVEEFAGTLLATGRTAVFGQRQVIGIFNAKAPPRLHQRRSFFKITLPLIAANLIAGGLLAFAMLEVSDSLVLAQKQAF